MGAVTQILVVMQMLVVTQILEVTQNDLEVTQVHGSHSSFTQQLWWPGWV